VAWDAALHTSVVIPVPPELLLPALAHSDTSAPTPMSAILGTISQTVAHTTTFNQQGGNLCWSADVVSLEPDARVLMLPRYLLFSGPSFLPTGILGSTDLGPTGLRDLVRGLLGKNCPRTTEPPVELFQENTLLSAWLLGVKANPLDFATRWTPYAAMAESVTQGPYRSLISRNDLHGSFSTTRTASFATGSYAMLLESWPPNFPTTKLSAKRASARRRNTCI
jgi:hypothetical protein